MANGDGSGGNDFGGRDGGFFNWLGNVFDNRQAMPGTAPGGFGQGLPDTSGWSNDDWANWARSQQAGTQGNPAQGSFSSRLQGALAAAQKLPAVQGQQSAMNPRPAIPQATMSRGQSPQALQQMVQQAAQRRQAMRQMFLQQGYYQPPAPAGLLGQ